MADRMGNHTFYGPGGTIDTTKPLTVVVSHGKYALRKGKRANA